MANGILAVVTGLVAWAVLTTVAGLFVRGVWAEYAAVAGTMAFTLPMLFARLSIGGVATFAAGWATAQLARRPKVCALVTGMILLVLFIPQHVMLWATFPVWYHLTFLLSLVPLTYLGGTIARRPGAVRGAP